jgi:Ca-activated chloride channel family protein
MHYAFRPGKTRLADGLVEAAKLAHPWNPRSTTVIVITDGDTVAPEVPRLPVSVSDVLVIGVGDPRAGAFIAGRQSRQDPSTLARVAARLGGVYHDGNQRQVPSAALEGLVRRVEGGPLERLGAREYALLAVALGAAALALLPLALERGGTAWRPGVTIERAAATATASGGDR